MLTNMFENRDPKLALIMKLGDCLGRSLRENVELFNIEGNRVTYITESNNVISGGIVIKGSNVILEDISVEDANLFVEDSSFNDYVTQKCQDFVGSLYEDNFGEADTSFNGMLDLWGTRLNFSKVVEKLETKRVRFDETKKILDTVEFKNLLEISDSLISFLKENKEVISEISEIRNSIKLSNTISNAFDFPYLTCETLAEEDSYTLRNGTNRSIYEMVCNQELIKKELLESRKQFDSAWATNDSIINLASTIYDKNFDHIESALAEAIVEVPYLALATKKQLTSVISKSLGLNEAVNIPLKDIRKFASGLYEMKKPVKEDISKLLNEKYGINIQNLKETPTFKSLINTQVVVFESLALLSPKQSVQRKVLAETSRMLRGKNGVEGIDINDYISDLFEAAGYEEIINETTLMQYLDFDKVATDLGAIGNVLKLIKGTMASQDGMTPPEMMGGEEQFPSDEMTAEPPEAMGNSPVDAAFDDAEAEEGMPPEMGGEEEMMGGGEEEMMGDDLEDEDMTNPAMSPEDAVIAGDEELAGETAEQEGGMSPEMMDDEEGGYEDEGEEAMMGQDDLMDNLSQLDALIKDLASELGQGEEEEGFEGEEEFGDEEEEEFGDEEGEEFEGEEKEEFGSDEEEEDEDEDEYEDEE